MTRHLTSAFVRLAGILVSVTAHADSAGAAAAGPGEVQTGLSNFGPAAIILAAAICLLVFLLLRGSLTRASRIISRKAGQRRMRKVLRRRSQEIQEDFILPGAYGGLTRIDYAVLTSGGILCIQAKHCNGIVFGGDEEPQWQNVDGMRRRKFLNPIIQNSGRTKALQKVVPDVPVENIVVFTGSAELKVVKASNVMHVRDLDSYIAKFVFGPCRIKDWDAVWLTVKAAALTDDSSRRDFHAQLSFS